MKTYLRFAVALLVSTVLFAADEADTSPRFAVEQFTFAYGREHPSAPSLSILDNITVDLGRAEDGALVATGSGNPIKLSEPLPAGAKISEQALRRIFAAIVERMNDHDVYGIVAMPSRDQIDPQSKEDLRTGGDKKLKIVIWFSEVVQVRSVAKGSRVPADAAVSNPKHARIVANSPIKPAEGDKPGSLFTKEQLDDYLRRLNRQPGRSVEAALSSTEEPGKVVLDYLVTEQKPWLVYAQVSNTGTGATDKLRERVGFVHNQLFNRDDIASIDYITSNINKANAVFGSYNYPLIFPDKLRIRGYGSWGDFNATTPPVAVNAKGEEFGGNSWSGGAELIASPYSVWKFAIDATAGAIVEHVEVKNKTTAQAGQADLWSPYLSLRAERASEVWNLTGSVGYETSFKSEDAAQLVKLGRLNTKSTYDLVRGDLSASTYLEPLFYGISSKNDWKRSTLAHEVSFSVRGQYALSGRRMIPQKEQAIGGYFSVRGYPESAVAGDNVFSGSAEYRFHIPRALQPRSEQEKTAANTATQEPAPTLFGRPFNYRPPRVYARPDWDLIFRTFLDFGGTEINSTTKYPKQSNEHDYSLLSTGVGVELQMLSNLNLRSDWGYVLDGIKTGVKSANNYSPGLNDTKAGSSRLHLLLTLVW